nr:RNA-directed DNA polymerase, eukaryota [Tanacetum cinerariifolium]
MEHLLEVCPGCVYPEQSFKARKFPYVRQRGSFNRDTKPSVSQKSYSNVPLYSSKPSFAKVVKNNEIPKNHEEPVMVLEDVVLNFEAINSWFSSLNYWTSDFEVHDRVVWIDVEGVPLNAWSKSSFNKIATKLGEFIFMDDSNSSNNYSMRLCAPEFGEDTSNKSEDFSDNNSVGTKNWMEYEDDDAHENIQKTPKDDDDVVPDSFQNQDFKDSSVEWNINVPNNGVDSENHYVENTQKTQKYSRETPLGWKILFLNRQRKVIIMGDFNEVRNALERYKSSFHSLNAAEFNMFIVNSHLIDIPLGGYSFTWSDKPILLKEAHVDYGPTPFCLYRSLFLEDDFYSVIVDSWNNDDLKRVPFEGNFPRRLDYDQSCDLEGVVSNEEIKRAIWDCGSDKSPGPDGFTFEFFKKYWSVVGGDVINAVKEFFNYSSFPKGCNSSFIALIPKARKEKCLLFKVKFQKAFDSVRWDHLDDTIGKFGFGKKWRGWIRGCLNSSKASILTDEFSFHRGLRRGDPLSPFLFIMVMESLQVSFQRLIDKGMFDPILVGKENTMPISHLFYADDAMFIGKWSYFNVSVLMMMLHSFFLASVLKVNIHKISLYGAGVRNTDVHLMADSFGCLGNYLLFTYLGVTVSDNMTRVNSWIEVVKKVSNKLSSWKAKSPSVGGRLTLIKSVLGAIPTYYMSLFKASWKKMLAHKNQGGLGVNSLYVLNLVLMFKWIWRFLSSSSILWTRVIKSIHELQKDVSVAIKFQAPTVTCSFRRPPHSGIELSQFFELVQLLTSVTLSSASDRCFWTLHGLGVFCVKSAREEIDKHVLVISPSHTRWSKPLPPPLSPPSAKLMIVALEEYGHQSRRGAHVPNKWRSSYSGIEFYELMIDLQSIHDPESVNF